MTPSEAITYLIDKKILTGADLARMFDTSSMTINRWKREVHTPPHDIGEKLIALAKKAKKRKPLC